MVGAKIYIYPAVTNQSLLFYYGAIQCINGLVLQTSSKCCTILTKFFHIEMVHITGLMPKLSGQDDYFVGFCYGTSSTGFYLKRIAGVFLVPVDSK